MLTTDAWASLYVHTAFIDLCCRPGDSHLGGRAGLIAPLVGDMFQTLSPSHTGGTTRLRPSYDRILTRFNKNAIQGTPQMAVDMEPICLSRVYSYYYKCNLPLFYGVTALTRYLSILFLNILTLLACTHSANNVFHTLMVLCEN